MKILFITDSHCVLIKNTWTELSSKGHGILIHTVSSFESSIEDVIYNYNPELIITSVLKPILPKTIWKDYPCFIIYPGIKIDQDLKPIEWAIMTDQKQWGVSLIEVDQDRRTGKIWSSHYFKMRPVSKSNLYRHEVSQATVKGILDFLDKIKTKTFIPESIQLDMQFIKVPGGNSIRKTQREINWAMPTDEIIKKINASDSFPGLLEQRIFPFSCYIYGAHKEDQLTGTPGHLIAKRDQAICIATGDGAVWISHLKRKAFGHFKLPATLVLEKYTENIPISERLLFYEDLSVQSFREIWYEEKNQVGYLHFNFYNGAMSTDQCIRLRRAFFKAKTQDTNIIVFMGGQDFWATGIDLNQIEHAPNSADETWNNTLALNDLIYDIMTTTSHYVIAAIHGNTTGGGLMMALATDEVLARDGLILKPHFKRIGLYGSQYWTYLLPKRVGEDKAKTLINTCHPINSQQAKNIGLIDDCSGETITAFKDFLNQRIETLKATPSFLNFKTEKQKKLTYSNHQKPINDYRDKELNEMWKNIYVPHSQYHALRYFYVNKIELKKNLIDLNTMTLKN